MPDLLGMAATAIQTRTAQETIDDSAQLPEKVHRVPAVEPADAAECPEYLRR